MICVWIAFFFLPNDAASDLMAAASSRYSPPRIVVREEVVVVRCEEDALKWSVKGAVVVYEQCSPSE